MAKKKQDGFRNMIDVLSLPIRIVNDSSTLSRSQLLRLTQGNLPDLDIDNECRYPTVLDVEHYYKMYKREGVPRRVVGVFPEECWQMEPDIFETENLKEETDFEAAWKEMNDTLRILTHLETLDEVSGIGQFGILLLGFDDRKLLSEPVGLKADGSKDGRTAKVNLKYVRSLSQKCVKVGKIESDPTNPRFGRPTEYMVTFADPESVNMQGVVEGAKIKDQKVHWSRVIHVAENCVDSLFLGTPRLEPVFNRCFDIRKILGANGQGYWQTGFPGFSIETQSGIEAPDFDKEVTKEEVAKFLSSQQRALLLEGLTARPLNIAITDPKPHYETHLADICIAINVPMRIFKGSEEAKLASSQDQRTWNKRLMKRNARHVNPNILKAFFERMFLVGALPTPKNLFIEWPDLNAPTENDRATTATKIVEAMAKYIQGNVSSLMGPKEFLTLVMGFPLARVEMILKMVGKKVQNLDKLTKVATTPKPAPAAGKTAPKLRKAKKQGAGEGAGRPG